MTVFSARGNGAGLLPFGGHFEFGTLSVGCRYFCMITNGEYENYLFFMVKRGEWRATEKSKLWFEFVLANVND